ncbi:MAG: hypothetical protein ABIA63_06065, partial [bacterium]
MGKELKGYLTMVARSEIQHVSNSVNRGIYAANQDVLKGVIFAATLDNRTCVQCASLDTQYYGFTAKGGDHNGPQLPLHVHCRCCYIPITKTWKELGSKIPEHITGKSKAPFMGNVLPRQSYDDWLKKQPVEFQQDILGPARYKLWKNGDIKLKQMATTKRVLRIDELEQMLLQNRIIPAPSPLDVLSEQISRMVLPKIDDVWDAKAGEILAAYKEEIFKAADNAEFLVLKGGITPEQFGSMIDQLRKRDDELLNFLENGKFFDTNAIAEGHPGLYKFFEKIGIKEAGYVNYDDLRMTTVYKTVRGVSRESFKKGIDEINAGIKAFDDYIKTGQRINSLGYNATETFKDAKNYINEYRAFKLGKYENGNDILFIKNKAEYEKIFLSDAIKNSLNEAVDSKLFGSVINELDIKILRKLALDFVPEIKPYADYMNEALLNTLVKRVGPWPEESLKGMTEGVINFIGDVTSLKNWQSTLSNITNDLIGEIPEMNFKGMGQYTVDDIKGRLLQWVGQKNKVIELFEKQTSIVGLVAENPGKPLLEGMISNSVNRFQELFKALPNTFHNKIMKEMGVKGPNFYTIGQKSQWWLGTTEQKAAIEKEIAEKIKATGKKISEKVKGNKTAKPIQSPKIETVPDYQPFNFSVVDEIWEKEKTQILEKLEETGNIGGMHTKYFAYDKDGGKWLFKPYKREPFRA